MIRPSLVFVAVFLSPHAQPVAAEQSIRRSSATEKQEVAIVIRVSKELLVDLTRQDIEMTIPIQRSVEGMSVTGSASGKGVTSIELLSPSDENADFVISVPGTAVGRLRSDVGLAIVRLTSRAQFTAQKRVHFDGINFRADAAVTTSRNCTTVDRVCAKRQGPLGKVVEHVGRHIADRAIADVNQLAEEITADILAKTFDETAEELIEELNRVSGLDEVVLKYFPETRSWTSRLAARHDFLIAGFGPPAASLPKFLLDPHNPPQALMELWMRLTPGQAAMLQLIGELDVAYDLLREELPEEEAKSLYDDVKVERHGEWSVIKVGLAKPKQ
jgi:hypothetical protein